MSFTKSQVDKASRGKSGPTNYEASPPPLPLGVAASYVASFALSSNCKRSSLGLDDHAYWLTCSWFLSGAAP